MDCDGDSIPAFYGGGFFCRLSQLIKSLAGPLHAFELAFPLLELGSDGQRIDQFGGGDETAELLFCKKGTFEPESNRIGGVSLERLMEDGLPDFFKFLEGCLPH